jgi:hypothetical protein
MKKVILYRIIIVVGLIIAFVASLYFYVQYQNTKKLLQNPTLMANEEAKALIAKVSTIIELPTGEDPSIATVSDKSKLADQPFFARAQNGDKVLIYTRAKEAILYRPSENKLIQVAPISNNTANQPSTQSAVSATPVPTSVPILTPTPVQNTVKVAIYNGTKIAGLAGTTGEQLVGKIPNLEVVKKADATGNYTSILVIDLTGKNSTVAKQIAADLGGTVGTLPPNEAKPDADILVILGK